jgi:hypothetical protein
MVYAMYHPAAALRSSDVERQSYDDAAGIPAALLEARRRRHPAAATATEAPPRPSPTESITITQAADTPTFF